MTKKQNEEEKEKKTHQTCLINNIIKQIRKHKREERLVIKLNSSYSII